MLILSLLVLGTHLAPTDSHFMYVGRWDHSEPAAPACQWPACEVKLRTENAGSVTFSLDETGHDEWQVVVDGAPTKVLELESGPHDYEVEFGGAGGSAAPMAHTIELVKRTEAFVGTTRFRGATLNGTALPKRKENRFVQVVGDSITCGYGNEGANQNEHFKPQTEDAYMSYASVGARLVHAEVSIIAWSGRKMWPDNTVPSIYDLVLPTQETPIYNFKGPAPAAVVINLATNDFGPGIPDEAKWTGAYEAFIRRVWTHYPKALIYCATGSMMSDDYPAGRHSLTTLTDYLRSMIQRMNDSRLHLLQFDPQKQENGYGADWHPSIKTDEIMGATMAAALHRDLGWN